MRVTIDDDVYRELREHARAAWPREACGLLGAQPAATNDTGPATADLGATVQFVRYLPTRNRAGGDRFAIDPLTIAHADHQLRAAGLQLRGVFHSHPRSRAIPSAADRSTAWPDLIYVILGVLEHGSTDLTAWSVVPDTDTDTDTDTGTRPMREHTIEIGSRIHPIHTTR